MKSHRTVIGAAGDGLEPAVMYLHSDLIDIDTEKQIRAMISHSSLNHIRVMPDGHAGNGCCIGFTAILHSDCVVPSYIGGDIGCGILTYPLRKKKLNLKRVESIIKTIIPMGDGRGKSHSVPAVSESFISRYLSQAQPELDSMCMCYGVPEVSLDFQYFLSLCEKIGADVDSTIRSFGTLGSGNHFVEVNVDIVGSHYLTIHSGSRSFGMKLFEYHNAKVDRAKKCLTGAEAIDYFMDLICAQYLAKMNRHIMLQLILRELSVPFTYEDILESTHNYIEFADEIILRKGAISAREGETCIIALNMKDGIAIGTGIGNPEWNYSCAHGCGRIMTRTEARRRINLKDYKKAMENVVSTSVCEGTLDEAPQAYKDMNVVLQAIEPTMTLDSHLVSVINLKGTSSI